MPSRILREQFITSGSVASLPPETQLRFPRYLLVADDWGGFQWQAVVLWARLFPHLMEYVSIDDVAGDLEAMVKAGILRSWEDAEGRRWASFPGWFRHNRRPRPGAVRKTPTPPWEEGVPSVEKALAAQRPTTRAGRLGVPEADPEGDRRKAAAQRKAAWRARRRAEAVAQGGANHLMAPSTVGKGVVSDDVPGDVPDVPLDVPGHVPPDVPGQHGTSASQDFDFTVAPRRRRRGAAVARPQPQPQPHGEAEAGAAATPFPTPQPPPLSLLPDLPPDVSPVVARLPCTGGEFSTYAVTEAAVAAWADAFPNVDPRQELKRIALHLETNPKKTFRGMPKFLLRWMARSQDWAARNGRLPSKEPMQLKELKYRPEE